MYPIAALNATTPAPRVMNHEPIRIMLIDDSLTARHVIMRVFDGDPEINIVAQASTAERAIEQLASLRVDVILLDLAMPGLGGMATLPMILEASKNARVLVVSALTVDGTEQTLRALQLGASDTIPKPTGGMLNGSFQEELRKKVKRLGRQSCAIVKTPNGQPQFRVSRGRKTARALAVGGSTGGIHALCRLLKQLPQEFDIPIFITQHLPNEFMDLFARQLTDACGREARIAENGMRVRSGMIYVAPGKAHMLVRRLAGMHMLELRETRAENGCLPSVNPMLSSLAEAYDGKVAGVILSGMGTDGLEGSREVVRLGGMMLAQDQASSSVWGMPRAIVMDGLATAALSPELLANYLISRRSEPS